MGETKRSLKYTDLDDGNIFKCMTYDIGYDYSVDVLEDKYIIAHDMCDALHILKKLYPDDVIRSIEELTNIVRIQSSLLDEKNIHESD